MTGSAAGIRAGRAYVEVGTNNRPLETGLASAMRSVRGWVFTARSLGRQLLVGGGIFASVKSFADAGVEMAKLRKQTEMSREALAALRMVAEDAEVPFSELSKSLTKLQVNIAKPTDEVKKAFQQIGTSVEGVQRMSFDDTIALIADRLPKLRDESQRVATAVTLFGKSGAAMLPILEKGSKGLNEAAKEAQRLGIVMSQETEDAALKLDDAFDKLTQSTKGLRNEIVENLSPTIISVVEKFAEATKVFGDLAKECPKLAEGLLLVASAALILGGKAALPVAAGYSIWTAVDAFRNPPRFGGDSLADRSKEGEERDLARLREFDKLGRERRELEQAKVEQQGVGAIPPIVAPSQTLPFDKLGRESAFQQPLAFSRKRLIRDRVGWIDEGQPDPNLGQYQRWGQTFMSEEAEQAFRDYNREPRLRELLIERQRQKRMTERVIRDDRDRVMAGILPSAGVAAAAGAAGDGPFGDFTKRGKLSLWERLGEDGRKEYSKLLRQQLAGVVERSIPRDIAKSSVDVLGRFGGIGASQIGFGQSVEQRGLKAAEETAKNTRDLVKAIREGAVYQ